ncbi:MAG: RDD family protein [Candidatus Saccharibacteria bacterium]|nr:RDD family protein [Moraxellaceae bacterium]
MQIYLARNNEQAGPYTLEQVNAMLANKQIVLADLAWHEGMANWLPLGQLTGGKLVYNPNQQKTAPTTPPFKSTATNTADTESLVNGATLATVGRRLSAALIDYLLLNFIIGVAFFSTMTVESLTKLNAIFTTELALLSNSAKPDTTQILKTMIAGIPELTLVAVGTAVLTLTLIQVWLISSRGQTVGKILLKIKIVDEVSGEKSTFLRSVILRSVFVKYIGYNIVGSLLFFVDLIFLFTKKNRTLHDRLAKTLVVNTNVVELKNKKS